jgi:hypothetical protein
MFTNLINTKLAYLFLVICAAVYYTKGCIHESYSRNFIHYTPQD